MENRTQLKKGDKVIYITRDTKTIKRSQDKSLSYTIEIVLRGIWDGEKAILYEQFDPRKLKTIVRNEKWLIRDDSK